MKNKAVQFLLYTSGTRALKNQACGLISPRLKQVSQVSRSTRNGDRNEPWAGCRIWEFSLEYSAWPSVKVTVPGQLRPAAPAPAGPAACRAGPGRGRWAGLFGVAAWRPGALHLTAFQALLGINRVTVNRNRPGSILRG